MTTDTLSLFTDEGSFPRHLMASPPSWAPRETERAAKGMHVPEVGHVAGRYRHGKGRGQGVAMAGLAMETSCPYAK